MKAKETYTLNLCVNVWSFPHRSHRRSCACRAHRIIIHLSLVRETVEACEDSFPDASTDEEEDHKCHY